MNPNSKLRIQSSKLKPISTLRNFAFCIFNFKFVRFNLVGVIGIGVQLALLALLTHAFGLNYLWATGIAVSLTVLHNFLWHERFTFYDRVRNGASRRLRSIFARFMKFNLVTGLISVTGNVLLMHWLRGRARLPLMAANLLAISICGIFNYVANDRLVFNAVAKVHRE
jgi:putative flippase GtrA